MKRGSGTVLESYSLGSRYTCTLIQDPEGMSPIQYMFMLVVHEQDAKTVLIVTCEHNEMQSEMLGMAAGFDEAARKDLVANAPPAYFCFFDQSGGHHIIEPLKRIPDAVAFRVKALAFAASQLGVADAPVPIESFEAESGAWMSKNKKTLLLVGSTTAIVVGAVAIISIFLQPRNYDDCILENMKGVASDVAATRIRWACRNKFPEPAPHGLVFDDPDEQNVPKLSDLIDSESR
jgi:hypothetical protein